MSQKSSRGQRTGLEIAVVGMAGRFPGANTIEAFWVNLKEGVESICFFSDQELQSSGVASPLSQDRNYVRANGYLPDIEYFDPAFFDYSPREAELMDPQLRLLHECIWEALEDAGYGADNHKGLVGLYVGTSINPDWYLRSQHSLKSPSERYNVVAFNDNHAFSTLISYKLNLKGPSFTLQTACSSSLVAINLACKGLLSGESDMALAGGVSIILPQKRGYLHQEGMVTSPDGHCRAFDQQARGTLAGNGTGIVVLKRLEEAIAHGDYIYALVKGSAINNDGRGKVGYTAPSVEGQAMAIRTALYMAEVEPESISYVEAHGTGTVLGDPVEIEGLKQAFNTTKRQFCAIGSVKSNVGHLNHAAGVAGFIKTVLALRHRFIPPSLHFNTPNPTIDFQNSPFYVNDRLCPWSNNHYPLRAGVSSFGIGGTNAHAILEEYSQAAEGTGELAPMSNRQYQLILLSAKTETALERMTKNLAAYFKNRLFNHENPVNPGLSLADAAYTLQVGRKAFRHRRMLVCARLSKAIDHLSTLNPEKVHTFFSQQEDRFVVFMFPGQGAQYVNMGLDLYRSQPLFRETMDRCFEILKPLMGYDPREILYPPAHEGDSAPGTDGASRSYRSDVTNVTATTDINQTQIAQPVIFTIEYALAKLLMSWGIKPGAMMGHSIGEYVAACLAGVFTLEDALALVTLRGKLMQQVPNGSMLSVSISLPEIEPLLNEHEELSLAAVNGPSRCVVSGPDNAIHTFERRLEEKGYSHTSLHTSHAFHSAMMDPVLKPFEEAVRGVEINEPQIPFISNLTGDWITIEQVADAAYWANHLRETVYFSVGLSELLKKNNSLFIEVGPGQVLSTLVRQHPDKTIGHLIINLVRHPKEQVCDSYYLLDKIGKLWLYGLTIEWPKFYPQEKRYRLPLPTYPFERQQFKVEADITKRGTVDTAGAARGLFPSLIKRRDMADWFYVPSWKRSLPPTGSGSDTFKFKDSCWLTFVDVDECSIGVKLREQLQQYGADVITVRVGEKFTRTSPVDFAVNPQSCSDYQRLVKELQESKKIPRCIVHLWGISKSVHKELDREGFDKAQDLGFFSLIYLAKAIVKGELSRDNQLEIVILTNNMQEVTGEEELCPEKVTVLGPGKVFHQENPNISCKFIDVMIPGPGTRHEQQLLENLLAEFTAGCSGEMIAYRGRHRWIQTFEPIPPGSPPQLTSRLRPGGVYLISGGLGDVGLALARYLVKRVKAKLLLTRRSHFPGREEWEKWLAHHGEENNISRKIRKLKALEQWGGEVMAVSADVADDEQMQKVIARGEERLGKINGVIHAAGIKSGISLASTLEKIDITACNRQFQPKVYGLLVLERLFQQRDRDLDFYFLTSSLASVLGGLGFAAYTAASLFMDYYVQQKNQKSPVPWISVNWDSWIFNENSTSSSANASTLAQADGAAGSFGAGLLELAMKPEEGIETFQRILSWQPSHPVIVSTGDLDARINQWIKLKPLEDQESAGPTFHSRPNLSNPYEAPVKPIEQKLAAWWREFFGIHQVGIHDDFFELGGDSLKAIALVSKINHHFHLQLRFSHLLQFQTIHLLAGQIEKYIPQAHQLLINAVEKRAYYPSSFIQETMFMPKNNPYQTRYNIGGVFKIQGDLQVKRFVKAFQPLVQRHEPLRTSFHRVNDQVVQRIDHETRFDANWIQCDETEAKKIMEGFIQPFDLSKAPLLRVEVLEVKREKFYVLLDIHHSISDGISINIIMKELWRLYEGNELEPLTIQYKDYAVWQHDQSSNGALKEHETYWLKQLKDFKFTQLTADSANGNPSAEVHHQHQQESIIIDQDRCLAIAAFCDQEKITRLTFLMAIFTLILSKETRQTDIAIGLHVSNRFDYVVRDMLGCFLEDLVLRSMIDYHDMFSAHLAKMNQTLIDAMDHALYPYEGLNRKLREYNDIPNDELFTIMANYLPAIEDLSNGQFTINFFSLPKKIFSKYHINFRIIDGVEAITLQMKYRSTLFSKQQIMRMLNGFLTMIDKVIPDKNTRIREIF
ncbi:MAG: SDR family oxidoreductase [Candidatus Aminicenantes bacterium]|jgi:acyl transferase domain-containing protein/acyl carrier protein